MIIIFWLWLTGKFYQTPIRPVLLYGTECWVIKRYHAQKMSVVDMRMLRWMYGNTRRDKVRNKDIRTKIGVASIEEKICLYRREDERKPPMMVWSCAT